jgi:ubiquinone/menaquinone biosynthesis C-methylase UbiE
VLDQPDNAHSFYFIDVENAAEIARLMKQARLLSTAFDTLPEALQAVENWHILDLACGPGEWVCRIAQGHPSCQVTGIDISQLMIDYATHIAETMQLHNTHFRVMDVRQQLEFCDSSFDAIHASLLLSFLVTKDWPWLLGECMRLLRPGGYMINIEPESMGSTNSDSLARYSCRLTEAMRKAGCCFTSYGEHYGISAVLPRLFQQAGFEQIRQEVFVLNYSAGMPAYKPFYENMKTFLKLLQPFIVQNVLCSRDEIETLYARAIGDMEAPDFCGAAYFQRLWGQKPT